MPDIITIAKVIAAIATIVGAFLALAIWLRPIRINPGVRLVFDGSGPDEITAIITNKSGKPVYVTACVSRGTYPWRYTVSRHLRQPFMAPRFYTAVRFYGPVHELISNGPIKIEPQQPVEVRHRLGSHPLSKFFASRFLIEVQLSNGRKIRSREQDVPVRWRLRRAG